MVEGHLGAGIVITALDVEPCNHSQQSALKAACNHMGPLTFILWITIQNNLITSQSLPHLRQPHHQNPPQTLPLPLRPHHDILHMTDLAPSPDKLPLHHQTGRTDERLGGNVFEDENVIGGGAGEEVVELGGVGLGGEGGGFG